MTKTEEKLKKSILEYANPICKPNSCGPDIYICPFCQSDIEDTSKLDDSTEISIMKAIEHYENCVWLWAIGEWEEEE